MTQLYAAATVSAAHYCKKCGKPRKVGTMIRTRTKSAQELLRNQIEREIDAEYAMWEKAWKRGHRGSKPTPNAKFSWYRSCLIREICERKRWI